MKLVINNLLILFFILIWGGRPYCQIEYSLIEGQALFLYYPQTEKVKTESIQATDIKLGNTLTTKLQGIRPLKKTTPWVKNNENILVAWNLPPLRGGDRWFVLIQTFRLETLDFDHRERLTQMLVDSFTQVYGNRSKAIAKIGLDQMQNENSRGVAPLLDWFKIFDIFARGCQAYYPIRYDFIPESDSTYLFYIRNRKELSVWHFTYPQDKNIKSKPSDWRELVTYSIDTIPFIAGSPYISMGRDSTKHLPFGEHHLYQSIQDTSFFKGNFKIIRQDKNTFCINLHLGDIYHIGKESIVKVGEVNVKDYPRWLLSKPLFIEDRDNNELIFLANVKRTNEAAPFPKIKVQKNRLELLRKYPGLKVN